MGALHLILFVWLSAVVAVFSTCRKTEWTKKEVIEWHERFGSRERGGLGYQGSDEQHHHFIARAVDSWVFIKVKRDELKMDDERPFSRASSAPLAHYAVDPARDFQKVEQKGDGMDGGQKWGAGAER